MGKTFVGLLAGLSERLSKVGLEELGPKIGLLELLVVGLNVVISKKWVKPLLGFQNIYQRWDLRKWVPKLVYWSLQLWGSDTQRGGRNLCWAISWDSEHLSKVGLEEVGPMLAHWSFQLWGSR